MKNHKPFVQNQAKHIAEQLRQLSRIYVLTQKFRCRYDNLIRGKLEYLQDKDKWQNFFELNSKTFKETEDGVKKELNKLVKQHEWGNYLLNIRGVGPGIAGGIIGELCGAIYASIEKDNKKIGDKIPKPKLLGYGPRKFEKTSDLWAYAGYAVKNGKAVKRRKGEAYLHNKYLKLTCYKFAENQIKQGDYYRKLYDERKTFEKQKSPDLTKNHIHQRSMRYIIKKFLSNINHDLILKDTNG